MSNIQIELLRNSLNLDHFGMKKIKELLIKVYSIFNVKKGSREYNWQLCVMYLGKEHKGNKKSFCIFYTKMVLHCLHCMSIFSIHL